MQHNTDRIQTTHIGSLPRPAAILELLELKETGLPYDRDEWHARLDLAVDDVVARQVEVGLDVVSDGEYSKNSFCNYVTQRLAGFGGRREGGFSSLVDAAVEPSQRKEPAGGLATIGTRPPPEIIALRELPVNDGPLSWSEREYEADIARLQSAGRSAGAGALFLTSVAVGQVLFAIPTEHYASEEAYLAGLADVLRDEYRAIADAGIVLQIDSPDFVMMRNRQYRSATFEEYRPSIERRIEALNHALTDVPEEMIRFHICWGNVAGPHHDDVPLADVVDLLLRVKAQAYSVEAANPRHGHEWALWEDVELPDGKILIPGVIDTVTAHVEHPELVAQRIVQYARIVGRENVIAAPDCGFATFVGLSSVNEQIMWMKLRSLVEGARLASERLF